VCEREREREREREWEDRERVNPGKEFFANQIMNNGLHHLSGSRDHQL